MTTGTSTWPLASSRSMLCTPATGNRFRWTSFQAAGDLEPNLVLWTGPCRPGAPPGQTLVSGAARGIARACSVRGRLRVLILHSRYLSGPASGENRVVEDELRLLREAGHDVELYAPERIAPSMVGSLREGVRAVWSGQASGEVGKIVREAGVDVVHCHNLFPALSPAVLRVAGDAGAAVVMTLHNFRLACLPATFLREGEVCELCLGHVPWRGIIHRCYRGSAAGSASLATSLTLHRAIRSFERIDLYLAVSEFLRSKHVEAGVPAARIVVKPNFAWGARRREGAGDYFLFAGRLSREKGVGTLLAAWRGFSAPLLIVGDGP